jgi:uncharacterized protein YjiS (DUF1127 family)
MNTNIIQTTHSGIVDRISGFFSNLNENRRRYSIYRQTLRELDRLSDRDLNDLGLHRATINSVALEAAYGK